MLASTRKAKFAVPARVAGVVQFHSYLPPWLCGGGPVHALAAEKRMVLRTRTSWIDAVPKSIRDARGNSAWLRGESSRAR